MDQPLCRKSSATSSMASTGSFLRTARSMALFITRPISVAVAVSTLILAFAARLSVSGGTLRPEGGSDLA